MKPITAFQTRIVKTRWMASSSIFDWFVKLYHFRNALDIPRVQSERAIPQSTLNVKEWVGRFLKRLCRNAMNYPSFLDFPKKQNVEILGRGQ